MGKDTQTRGKGRRGATNRVLREFSAGGVVFRDLDGKPSNFLFLIIQPKDTDRWQFPKGHLDNGESSEPAALREVFEEGGVLARIIQKIGVQQYFFVWDKKRIFKTVTFFLMEYVDGDPNNHDSEVEEAVFLPFNEALEKLTFVKDKNILKKAKALIEGEIQPTLI